jgi:hypothetical protein
MDVVRYWQLLAPKTQRNDDGCGDLGIDMDIWVIGHHCVRMSGPKNPVI